MLSGTSMKKILKGKALTTHYRQTQMRHGLVSVGPAWVRGRLSRQGRVGAGSGQGRGPCAWGEPCFPLFPLGLC